MDEVIEISSSPEPEPPPKTRQRSQAKSQRTEIYEDVIDISDSDEDMPLAKVASSSKNWGDSGTEPGPSRPGPSLPFSSSQANLLLNAAGRSAEHHAAPLFLPSNDDDNDGLEAPQPVSLVGADEDLPMAVHLSKASTPDSAPNPIDIYVVRVLEVIPDVQPEHVRTLLGRHINTHKDGLVELILHMLFEDSNYPKVDKKGKRKRDEGIDANNQELERGKAKIKIDYASKDRPSTGGNFYLDIALVRSVHTCWIHQ